MRLIFDIESNGLIKEMTKIHVICARDADTRETFVWRNNDEMDTIEEGVRALMEADAIIAHNGISFDIPAIRKLYPWFEPQGQVLDTLVLCRMIVPDVKDGDFKLNRKKMFPTHLIGSHSLDAWGWRVGKHKGNYSKDMIAKGLDPWANWNQEMEDYCVLDIDVTEIIWDAMQEELPPQTAIDLEHDIHALCGYMEVSGFPFDLEGGKALAQHLEQQIEAASAVAKEKYGRWLAPAKNYVVAPQWDDPKGINRARKYPAPRPEFGEDLSRAVWADVTVPKVTWRNRVVGGKPVPDRTKGAPFSPVVWKDFNPGSRHHIIDRFVTLHNWVPTDFTEKGFPEVNDAVLKNLKDHIPEAEEVANVLFFKKIYSQLAGGKQAWLNCVKSDGRIHGYVNVGGTVSGRCSHNHPNMGQIPSVILEKGADGKKHPVFGLKGEYGADCRSLFGVPEFWHGVPWRQIGIDLSGIEARCLAELCARFDDGEMINVVLTGDIHEFNMARTGINQRETIKRLLYGLMYGAGDYKLGVTADPLLNENAARKLGRELRNALMQGVPALRKAIEYVQDESERGYLIGLDGRKLGVRSKHSALNLRLQSDAAMIAKKWTVLGEQYLLDAGYDHGWDGDFALMAFVHDENQYASKAEIAQFVADTVKRAARDAGLFFGFKCRIDAEAKIGQDWCSCH